MASVSLATLRGKARTRADMVNSTFVSDDEVNEFCVSAWGELYDLLVQTFEDYHLESEDIAVVQGDDTYALPADFYKARGADLILSAAAGHYQSLERFEWSNRAQYASQWTAGYTASGHQLRYCIVGSNIVFAPVPSGSNTVRLWYTPTRPTLDASTAIDVIPGWEEYVVLEAAIQMLLKEESDPSLLMARKQALKQRIQAMATKRDADAPRMMIYRRRTDLG